VVLIKKERPAWQKGRLNGVGGKIEPGETPAVAIRREFIEEANLDVPNWKQFTTMSGADWEIHCFWATTNIIDDVKTMTDEKIEIREVDYLSWGDEVIQNLHWLIPMAITFGNGSERASCFNVNEIQTIAV
jgi:8-oxo-dGTP diphosphatase